MYGIIYKITNITNNKSYIGQTKRPLEKRKAVHKYDSKKSNDLLYRAIRKYGWENFTWEIICTCNSKQELNDKETEFIILFNTYHTFKNGYNLTYGGDYNPMFDTLVKEKQKASLLIAMKKYTGENNVMRNPIVKEKHKKSIQALYKTKSFWVKRNRVNEDQKSTYNITFPDGHIETIKGLNQFCKKYNLNQSKMSSVVTKKRNHHKGFKCELISNGTNGKISVVP